MVRPRSWQGSASGAVWGGCTMVARRQRRSASNHDEWCLGSAHLLEQGTQSFFIESASSPLSVLIITRFARYSVGPCLIWFDGWLYCIRFTYRDIHAVRCLMFLYFYFPVRSLKISLSGGLC
jgi:hypothetical protein